ncbi:hypothetical protein [Parasynechococcus sp.]|uniref:hypothetical protein n=1 Tax=Parasynechococcus sp. TaxID=3101203 RepID=UPI0037047BF5
MASSCLHRSGSRSLHAPGLPVRGVLVGALIVSALLLAPEEPVEQASICQRHNTVEACRVW